MRSAALVAWVTHLRGCDDCSYARVIRLAVGVEHFHAEVAPRQELCAAGVKLLDAWLDEPEPRGRA